MSLRGTNYVFVIHIMMLLIHVLNHDVSDSFVKSWCSWFMCYIMMFLIHVLNHDVPDSSVISW
jgi:isoprenylcysteine carboxyl methyltransferase (ICMT) family protein YpbQ